MRKSDKKIENQLRLALTDVCEAALKEIEGFKWLTHTINYTQFPKSLNVICVFETKETLKNYLMLNEGIALPTLIQATLKSINIELKNPVKQVLYDTEEACAEEHNGNWSQRLS